MVDNVKNYKKYTTTDVMLIECKLKLIQLSCFTDLGQLDWLNTPVYDLMYVQPPNVDALTKSEQESFERLAKRVLGRDVMKPKFLSLGEWIGQGGSGLQTLWSIYYLDKLNAKSDKPLIIYHFERFHPLCYNPLLEWFINGSKSKEIILLSVNATYMLDLHLENKEKLRKFIELNNGDIVSIEDFCIKVMGVSPNVIEKPYLYQIEKLYRKYCEIGEEI